MILEAALRIVGASLIGLAAILILFPKRFGWREGRFCSGSLLAAMGAHAVNAWDFLCACRKLSPRPYVFFGRILPGPTEVRARDCKSGLRILPCLQWNGGMPGGPRIASHPNRRNID